MFKVSKSFTAGAIALVFGVLGYQTALLVHYAAVASVVANRDSPDTVFVSVPGVDPGTDGPRTSLSIPPNSRGYATQARPLPLPMSAGGQTLQSQNQHRERRISNHSEAANKIYHASVGRRVETFRFDPNTVSVEDMQRLGFSEKQAQSIENYRLKGGRFRRKEDFAKSYVVSDSLYRRLENYIDIPRLDINKADSAAFDALPGIGGYFARKMVEYRSQLGGYSFPEQLMDIYHFDREKYEGLKDLIEVGERTPYPLWTLPADSLRLHPYIRNASCARAIVMFRTHNPPDSLSVQALIAAGILYGENALKLSKCIIAEP